MDATTNTCVKKAFDDIGHKGDDIVGKVSQLVNSLPVVVSTWHTLPSLTLILHACFIMSINSSSSSFFIHNILGQCDDVLPSKVLFCLRRRE